MLVVFQNLLISPLVLSIIFFVLPSAVTSSSPWPATSRPGGPRVHSWGFQQDEDYENLSDEPVSVKAPTPPPSAPRCKYNSCQDQEDPCHLMSAALGCSCPGLSSPHEPPEAPHLVRVWHEGGGVWAHWCAPASPVTAYRLWVEGQTMGAVDERTRVLDLGDVSAGAKVCVQALNSVGGSELADQSCTWFQPSSENSLALKLGLIGGGVALVVVLALALVLWRRRLNSHIQRNGGGTGQVL